MYFKKNLFSSRKMGKQIHEGKTEYMKKKI